MKLYLLILVVFMMLVACGQTSGEKDISIVTADTLQASIDKKEQERLEKRRKNEDRCYADSLRLDKVLKDAIKIAYQNISKDIFVEKYEVSSDGIPVSVEINLNHHFTKSNSHLIIRRNEPSAVHIDVFSKNDGKFIKVASHEQWFITYINDTIRDINGDGLNDFVVNSYGSTGCCLKAFSNVYLIRQDKKEFSKNFEFINPTFSPKEKIIRGVCYGHPGETEMYKYKWIGEKIDTLEYVSYEIDENGKTGKILISSDLPYSNKSKRLKVLNTVPSEYKKIEGFDWFSGFE